MHNPSVHQLRQHFNPLAAAVDRLRANLPAELLRRDQWLVWRLEQRRGSPKPTKTPYCAATGLLAATDDPRTWASSERAAAAYLRGGYAGLGFVFSQHDPYCGIDFDHCVDGAGNLLPAAARWVGLLDSYSEWSQSGTGVHVIVRADLPGDKGRKSAAKGVEVYSQLRYFCMTGNPLPDAPATINPRQAQVDALLAEVFPKATPTVRPLKEPPRTPEITTPTRAAPPTLPDGAVLDRACTSPAGWHLFMNGTGRGSQSELDWRLCCLLFEAGATFAQADRLFRRSALMRGKWDELHGLQSYGELTLAKAQGHVEAQGGA